MDRYIELAKKAKAIYPGIKLCGPVTTNEWQWYKWSNEDIYVNGRYYPWIEYFIKRLADEYNATGIKLVDVLDIHSYPSYNNNDAEALQGHRIYYDETYDYPSANGVKTIAGGWDDSSTKEYILKRIDGWLNEHFGANHGITTGVSEWATMSRSNPSLESVIYASHLGAFANNGVELFSPWTWSIGMWETLHLFSRNAKDYSVSSTSSLENLVSAYTTVNEAADSMTVIIVNRDLTAAHNVTINLNGFSVGNGNYKTLQLSSLPANETFKSHTDNALKAGTVSVNAKSFSLAVPNLSTTAVLITSATSIPLSTKSDDQRTNINIFPNPASDRLLVEMEPNSAAPVEFSIIDLSGRGISQMMKNHNEGSPMTIDISTIPTGIYLLKARSADGFYTKKFTNKR
jgi:hypothetical protein